MKCLSILQPFAWAILHAGKNVENRTWSTNYRGPLLIHTGKGKSYSHLFGRKEIFLPVDVTYPQASQMPFGAIIGEVELYDCRPVCASPWAEGPWCWMVRNPKPFATPLPLSGQRGLFDVDLKALHEIADALAAK